VCCFALLAMLGGPRIAMAFWWIVGRSSWENAFEGVPFLFNIIGFIFAPWTMLMFVAIGGEPVDGFDWVILAIGVLADLAAWANIILRRGKDVPSQYQQYVPADLK
jgi:hypothetical protein